MGLASWVHSPPKQQQRFLRENPFLAGKKCRYFHDLDKWIETNKEQEKERERWGVRELGHGHGKTVNPLSHIDVAVQESRAILCLTNNWDGEGSSGYAEATWKRATAFIRRYAERILERDGMIIPAPQILPGPDGGIDVHWETNKLELLVNVPPSCTDKATYFGINGAGDTVKGSFGTSSFNLGLMTWLMES